MSRRSYEGLVLTEIPPAFDPEDLCGMKFLSSRKQRQLRKIRNVRRMPKRLRFWRRVALNTILIVESTFEPNPLYALWLERAGGTTCRD